MEEVGSVSPVLVKYTGETIVNGLWGRPALIRANAASSQISSMIVHYQPMGMLHYFNKALDSGVTPAEISEIITHIAFYSGWTNAFAAINVVKDIFAERGIGLASYPQLRPSF